MAKIQKRSNIEIERNPVERILMKIKDVVQENGKIVLYSFGGVVGALIIIIAASVILENRSASELVRFETIMAEYQKKGMDNEENIGATIRDLEALIDASYFGFTRERALYITGNLYYDLKRFDKAEEYFQRFADSSSDEPLVSLALLKSAQAAEEAKNFDSALKQLKALEEDRSEGMLGDQILYNIGGVYKAKGDLAQAKKYYNEVITLYPQSALAAKAKERLFLLGLK